MNLNYVNIFIAIAKLLFYDKNLAGIFSFYKAQAIRGEWEIGGE